MLTSLYIIVTFDEFYVIDGIIINQGASGTSMHNVCNALGRTISHSIQKIQKLESKETIKYIEDLVKIYTGFTSETMWMHETMGSVLSIPDVFAKILQRHIDVTEALEEMHTGEEEDNSD